jgi:hypothetical protein
MPRQSYIYDERLKKMVPKDEYYAGLEAADFPMIQPDIEPFKSIIDGEVIGSRRDLRNHMKKHNVVPTSEFSAEWSRAAARRREIQQGRHDKAQRLQALSDSFEHVRNQNRAKSGR